MTTNMTKINLEHFSDLDIQPKLQQQQPFTMDMVHSEAEVLHGLRHLMGVGATTATSPRNHRDEEGGEDNTSKLQGHETMVLYRNVRKKYSSVPQEIKEGLHCMETFRTPEKGLEAAYRAALCRGGPTREASALYVAINPRNVSRGMAITQDNLSKWMQIGLTKEQPKGMNREDYIGTLDKAFHSNILKCQSRKNLDMIDVDDPDPTTWLRRIREAIGVEHIEMILETKNGYHVVYRGKEMKPNEHQRLQSVLMENPGDGPLSKVSRGKGSAVACALPGGYQSYHKTKIIYCSCVRKDKGEDASLTGSG